MRRNILAALVALGALAPLFSACFEGLDTALYYCDENGQCPDLPTTVCHEEHNLCVCPKPGHLFCDRTGVCELREVCHPPPCHTSDAGDADAPDGD